MWARIESSSVVEITNIDPEGRYHPSLEWVACPTDVLPGWSYIDGTFAAPVEPEPDYANLIAARRYNEEIRGITCEGSLIDTGRDSQALITGAALAAVIDPAYICNWKSATGFITLDATQIIGIASAVRAHVQACFDREAELMAALIDGTYIDPMLNEGWPA